VREAFHREWPEFNEVNAPAHHEQALWNRVWAFLRGTRAAAHHEKAPEHHVKFPVNDEQLITYKKPYKKPGFLTKMPLAASASRIRA
jgi:hypothetical protein